MTMNDPSDVTEKVVDYMQECTTELGVEILAPDINESGVDFTPLYKEGEKGKGVIRFGARPFRERDPGLRRVLGTSLGLSLLGPFHLHFAHCPPRRTKRSSR